MTPNSPERNSSRGPFITTASGARFYLEEVNIQDIPIEDIAHALSMNCRFNGHVGQFYSVAEHSVIVAELVSPENKLTALLHDVSEAFIPDMPRPFKAYITGFDEYEDRIHKACSEHFGTHYPLPEEIKYIDRNIVRDEAEVLYDKCPDWFINNYERVCNHEVIVGFSPWQAKAAWLADFKRYTQ